MSRSAHLLGIVSMAAEEGMTVVIHTAFNRVKQVHHVQQHPHPNSRLLVLRKLKVATDVEQFL